MAYVPDWWKMSENNNDQTTETDIFQQQKKTIDTLIDVLEKQGTTEQTPQIIYTAPAAEAEAATPNYLLYIAIGVLVFILIKKL